eukprot:GFUD01133635.1.p1 GENE.GFUD01133635.1~~GFUD01133635.1.p1  ORF type:complete len:105 (+),score=20.84 GFUD01133635.1:82-396(+)
METGNTYKSIFLAQRRMKKFNKKTWSEKLTDIKVITPQPSVFGNLAEIVFYEEEEEDIIEEKRPLTVLAMNQCDKLFQQKLCLWSYQNCHCYKTSASESGNYNS